jgi:hypothetical protein
VPALSDMLAMVEPEPSNLSPLRVILKRLTGSMVIDRVALAAWLVDNLAGATNGKFSRDAAVETLIAEGKHSLPKHIEREQGKLTHDQALACMRAALRAMGDPRPDRTLDSIRKADNRATVARRAKAERSK